MKIHLETACLCQKGVELWLYMYYWMNSGNSHDLHVLWVYTIHNNTITFYSLVPRLSPLLSGENLGTRLTVYSVKQVFPKPTSIIVALIRFWYNNLLRQEFH